MTIRKHRELELEKHWTPEAILAWETANIGNKDGNPADLEEALEIVLVLQTRLRRERAIGNMIAEDVLMLGHQLILEDPAGLWHKQWTGDAIRSARSRLAHDLRPIPDYADLMTIREFAERVADDLFTNNDGTGYYATETQVSALRAVPSNFREGRIDPEFTHVVWFNK